MNAEERQIQEINRVKKIISKTSSPSIKKDYSKYLKKLEKELDEYKKWRDK